jgi:hypothetical protein
MDNTETQATLGTRLKNEMLVSFDKTTIISIKTFFVRIYFALQLIEQTLEKTEETIKHG